MDRAAIVLAAGAGTRMKSAMPKVLHKVAGLPILGHVIDGLKAAGVTRIVVVTAPDAQPVRDYAAKLGAASVVQDRQLGTGHAAAAAASALKGFKGELLVAYGDMPLLTAQAFEAAFTAAPSGGLAIVAFHAANPGHYGRVILDKDGVLDRIVEFKDAKEEERKTDLCNAGLMVAEAEKFFAWAGKLDNKNAQSEFYLTDVPALAKKDGARCAVSVIGEREALGVNSRAELAQAERQMQACLRDKALAAGVTMSRRKPCFFLTTRSWIAMWRLNPLCSSLPVCAWARAPGSEVTVTWKAPMSPPTRSSGRSRGFARVPRSGKVPISAISWK